MLECKDKYVYLPTTDTNYTIRKNYFDPLTNTFNISLFSEFLTNLHEVIKNGFSISMAFDNVLRSIIYDYMNSKK
jgi:hypothetical protein